MDALRSLRGRVAAVESGLQSGELVLGVVQMHETDILELQKIQLLQGKASDGQDIRPYYSEDLKPGGYFKSAESAKRYSVWKQGLSYPYSAKRNPDAPNLYINGKFHSELGVEFGPSAVSVVGTTPYARGIMAKYGAGTFGLTLSGWASLFRERGGFDELLTEIKSKIYD